MGLGLAAQAGDLAFLRREAGAQPLGLGGGGVALLLGRGQGAPGGGKPRLDRGEVAGGAAFGGQGLLQRGDALGQGGAAGLGLGAGLFGGGETGLVLGGGAAGQGREDRCGEQCRPGCRPGADRRKAGSLEGVNLPWNQ